MLPLPAKNKEYVFCRNLVYPRENEYSEMSTCSIPAPNSCLADGLPYAPVTRHVDMRTLTALTSKKPKVKWDVIYLEKGKILSRHVDSDNEDVLEGKLESFFKEGRHLLLVLRLRKGFFKSKYTATIVKMGHIKNLSWRHNLHVLLRNTYANGEEICAAFDKNLRDTDREERIRTYRITSQLDDAWFVLKEIKNNIQLKPVLLLFSSAGITWDHIRHMYVTPLVDFDEQFKVIEIHYDQENPNKVSVQDIFLRFNVRRVPTWLLATPSRTKLKGGVQITRFENFRDVFFSKQLEKGRKDMSVENPQHVEEAFTNFLRWGVKQSQSFKSRQEVTI